MIKGKWRIDLGGKIKGAKSVALGSAVTKRGQDNSLQMCERCKYQTGEGRQLGGPGMRGGGWAASGVGRAGDPWATAPYAWPFSSGSAEGGKRVVGEPQVSSRGSVSEAQLRRPGAALQVTLPPRWGPEVEGSNPTRVPLRPPLPAPGLAHLSQAGQADPALQASSPAPASPSSLSPPLPSPAGWAAVAPSAVEASGAAVCGGHFAEEPGAEGMQMRQTQGGERRSPEETGGRALGRFDGCLPRGREGKAEGSARHWVQPPGCGPLGAGGPGLDARVPVRGWRCGGGDGIWRGAHPPTQPPRPLPTSQSWFLYSRPAVGLCSTV